MRTPKKISAFKLAALVTAFMLLPALAFSQAAKPAAKPAAKAAETAPVETSSSSVQHYIDLIKPTVELNIPLSIPISGISDLYTIGFGVLLNFSSEAKWIPYTNIGLQTGYLTFSSDLDGFVSSFSTIPFVLYLEPCYITKINENFTARPFGRFGLGGSLSSGSTDPAPAGGTGSYSSFDGTIMFSGGSGLVHSSFPQGLEVLLYLDYMILLETETTSMLNINLGAKYRFYTADPGAGTR